MRSNVGTFAAALGFVAVVGAFHTPYRPEQSRHYDVTKTDSFHPITEKVYRAEPKLCLIQMHGSMRQPQAH